MIAQGGRFGGWALYMKENRAKFVYNLLGMQEFVTEADDDLGPGSHQVRAGVRLRRGRPGQGRRRDALLRRQPVGAGRVDLTQPMVFSADETTDIGDDYGMPVSADYAGTSKFNGRSTWSRSMSVTTTIPT